MTNYLNQLIKFNSIILLFSVGGRKLADVEHALEKCCDIIQAVNVNKHYDLMVQSFNAIMVIFYV